LIAAFEAWITTNRARLSAKAPLGEALKYIAKYWEGLCLFLTDGRIEMDSNAVERTIRPIALSRKNALFAGHDAAAANWGVIASLVETCKLNNVDPHAYLANTLTAIINGHKQSQINDLLPWNYVKYWDRRTAYDQSHPGSNRAEGEHALARQLASFHHADGSP
jgi:transposase